MGKYAASTKFLKVFYINGFEIMQRNSDNYINISHVARQDRSISRTTKNSKMATHFSRFFRHRYIQEEFLPELYRTGVLEEGTPAIKSSGLTSGAGFEQWIHPFLFLEYFQRKGAAYKIAMFNYMIRK